MSVTPYRYALGFIGAGNMAEAIARGAVSQGVVPSDQIIAADPSENRRRVFESIGTATASGSASVIAQSVQVVLAVKPQTLPSLAEDLARLDVEHQVIVSIMAGISSRAIERAVGRPARVVRVMPNTPLMVGRGMAGIALGENAHRGDDDLAMRVFASCGEAVRVEESQLDAVTAVSGSGPAYLFYLAEAMREAADSLGLGDHADLFINQTLLGAAELLNQSPDGPAELRRKVTSPGGTTQAAIEHLDDHAVHEHIAEAVRAAHRRSVELGA